MSLEKGLLSVMDKNVILYRQKDNWSFGRLVFLTTGLLDDWTFRHLDFWTTGLLDNWSFGQLVFCQTGLEDQFPKDQLSRVQLSKRPVV